MALIIGFFFFRKMTNTPTATQMRKNIGIVMPSTTGNMLLFFFLLRVKVVLPGDEFTVPGEVEHDLPDVHTEGFPVTLFIIRKRKWKIKNYLQCK